MGQRFAARRRGCLTLLLSLAIGCANGERARAPQGGSQALGTAAARVNGEVIALDEVRWLSAATGLAPREALARLVAERLLVQYASARGYDDTAPVRRGVARASVRALLAQQLEGPGTAGVEDRKRELEAWLAELARRTPVVYDEAVIQQTFASQSSP